MRRVRLAGEKAPTFSDSTFTQYLEQQNVKLLAPVQMMDKWRLSRSGVQVVDKTLVKQALPFQ
ncbi:MAG TPA: hypothetical protein VFK05_07070 [Polyangiaceae bacterium]|nr:hypothetical protein [Polyangiaceae bacterium]